MPASMLSPAPIVLRAPPGSRQTARSPRLLPARRLPRAERQDDDVAAALFDNLLRRALARVRCGFLARQILQLAQARFQQMDAAAGLFERGAGSVQNQLFAERLGEGRYPRVEIVRHAERQTTAGDNVICLRRPQRQLVETALLDPLQISGPGRIKRNWLPVARSSTARLSRVKPVIATAS